MTLRVSIAEMAVVQRLKPDMAACRAYYGQWGLYWPYNDQGEFLGAAKP